MGIPKFYRWISERYPLCSQLIEENRVPEFDHLYLDMNGILHNCSHDDDATTKALPPDKMFAAIFAYIEHLFNTIKPKRLFFMAIDGVAPRAKMNQQRSRRFRSAKDAYDMRKAAAEKGLILPEEDYFDSNCITPGTVYMQQVSKQLSYFINKKISEDSLWRNVNVIFSGHNVPGEGEHKIAEFIRNYKASKKYDPNIRHCLYGLDADLIMLSLLSHDPHFCLLREEVRFGGNQSKEESLERQNFFLFHISLLREYLELEFKILGNKISFEFDFERIIDDFILLALFIGNDFLPELPGLHINEGALTLLFDCYMECLPKIDNYINDKGKINLQRLEAIIEDMIQFEKATYNKDAKDKKNNDLIRVGLEAINKYRSRGNCITVYQKQLVEMIRKLCISESNYLDIEQNMKIKDKLFCKELCERADLCFATMEKLDGQKFIRIAKVPEEQFDNSSMLLAKLKLDDRDIDSTLSVYDNAKVVSNKDVKDLTDKEVEILEAFERHRRHYYSENFGIDVENESAVAAVASNYVEGLQWVLYYYYQGCPSWSWFYGYHYSPMISDILRGLKKEIQFELGEPFKPLEQLMSVLPSRSSKLVPLAYQKLMTDENSPLHEFYPTEFKLDQNGKRNKWEAVVLIPFINADKLKETLHKYEHLLTSKERLRNREGLPLSFIYDKNIKTLYQSAIPTFADFNTNCKVTLVKVPQLEADQLSIGLAEDVRPGRWAFAGFPTLKTVKFESEIKMQRVNIFYQESRNESIVLKIYDNQRNQLNEQLMKNILMTKVYINWPYLQEALIVEIWDDENIYEQVSEGVSNKINCRQLANSDKRHWHSTWEQIKIANSKRGVLVSKPAYLIRAAPLTGMKILDDESQIKDFDTSNVLDFHPLLVIFDNQVDAIDKDPRYVEKPGLNLFESLPIDTAGFYLGKYNYGQPLRILSYSESEKVNIRLCGLKNKEPRFVQETLKQIRSNRKNTRSAFEVGNNLHIKVGVLNRILSSYKITHMNNEVQIGLRLRNTKLNLKVLGYSEYESETWCYTSEAIALIQRYIKTFSDLFKYLRSNINLVNKPNSSEIFGSQANQEIVRLREWMKYEKINEFRLVPVNYQSFYVDAELGAIETAGKKMNEFKPSTVPFVIQNVPRTAILKPDNAEMRLTNQEFQLGDRVVYVLNYGKVPIGTIGTVICVFDNLIEVIADSEFLGGSDLAGKCSSSRGLIVNRSAILNLTNRQFIVGNRSNEKANPILSILKEDTPKSKKSHAQYNIKSS